MKTALLAIVLIAPFVIFSYTKRKRSKKSDSLLTKKKIFIVASSLAQAVGYGKRNGYYEHHDVVYIDRQVQLFGVDGRGKKLHFVGTYHELNDYVAIEELAEMRGFSIVYAPNY